MTDKGDHINLYSNELIKTKQLHNKTIDHDLNEALTDNLLNQNYYNSKSINENIECCDSYDEKCHVQKRPVIE